MAKRSYHRGVDQQDQLEESTGESPEETVRLACLKGAIVKLGPPQYTREYIFNKGEPVDVALEDAEKLLAKRMGCCGTPPKPYFVKV